MKCLSETVVKVYQTSGCDIPEDIIFQICFYKQSRDMNTQNMVKHWFRQRTGNKHIHSDVEKLIHVCGIFVVKLRLKCKPRKWINAELPAVLLLLSVGSFSSLVML
jgi:hypothetical protein